MGIPSFITLAIWVSVTGDAHITRVLGMGIPKTRGCPYLCDTALPFLHTSLLRSPSRIRPPLFPDNLPYSSHKLLPAPTTPTLSVHSPFLPSWVLACPTFRFPSGVLDCCYTVMSCLHTQHMTKALPTFPLHYLPYLSFYWVVGEQVMRMCKDKR